MPVSPGERLAMARLLDPTDPEDALTVYYALYYPSEKATAHLTWERDEPTGFLVICQTAYELFTPLVVLRSRSIDVTINLLRGYLTPGEEYLFAVRECRAQALQVACRIWDEDHEWIYTLEPREFMPHHHPSVRRRDRRDGRVGFEIVVGGRVASRASSNWESPYFGEIGVVTKEHYRGQGLGKAVVSACTEVLLSRGIAPLYITSEDNLPSRRLCEALGYRFRGHREFTCRGVLR